MVGGGPHSSPAKADRCISQHFCSEKGVAHEIDPLLGRLVRPSWSCPVDWKSLRPVLSHPLRRARGKKTLEKRLSVAQLGLHENWNHGNADDPHVGSIMLAPDLLPFIGVFALLEAGVSVRQNT